MENVHKELKKIQMWWLWQKFQTQYWIKGTYYRCSWKKRFNCDQCGKIFTRGCDLKVCLQIIYEKDLEFDCDHCGKNFTKVLIWKYIYKHLMSTGLKLQQFMKIKISIVINVANILLDDAIWKYLFKMFMKISWKYIYKHLMSTGLKLQQFMKIKISIVINVANILLDDAIWKYLFKMFMKIHELWTLWQIFNQSIQFVGNLSQNQNSEAQRHYDCDSCGRSSTQLENLNT